MNKDKVVLDQVSKSIKRVDVLKGVSMQINRGEIVGLLGPNGSGKTMILRAMSGLIACNSGEVNVFGQQIGNSGTFPRSMGIVISPAEFWGDYSGFKNLKMLASIKGEIRDAQVRKSIARVGLDPDMKKPVRSYSMGMKQRLAIAQAIMESPELILLDEPTNALDTDGRALLRNIILQERERGATVVIAMHEAPDLERICDRLFKVEEGRAREIDANWRAREAML